MAFSRHPDCKWGLYWHRVTKGKVWMWQSKNALDSFMFNFRINVERKVWIFKVNLSHGRILWFISPTLAFGVFKLITHLISWDKRKIIRNIFLDLLTKTLQGGMQLFIVSKAITPRIWLVILPADCYKFLCKYVKRICCYIKNTLFSLSAISVLDDEWKLWREVTINQFSGWKV